VFLAVTAIVPSLPSQNAVSVREVFGLPLKNVRLRLVLGIVVLFVLGHFGAYTFVRPFLESNASATPFFITAALMIFGAGGAIGNFIAGHTVTKSVRASFIVGGAGLVGSLLLMLASGHGQAAPIILLALWGMSFGVVQLSQLTMTQAAAPDTFEAAMSLNTLAYNTSIAIGALVGGLFVDNLGVRSVIWFGAALIAASLLLVLSTRRTTAHAMGASG
jgi:predicted MFS family arabinose efflux permease